MALDFNTAIAAATAGQRITRTAWNKAFCFQRPADTLPSAIIGGVKSLPASVKQFLINEDKGSFEFSAYFCQFTEQGSIMNGWWPSVADLTATDWVVLD